MRVAVVIALLALAGCVPEDEPPTRQLPAEDTCGAEPLQLFVGLPFESRDFEQEGRPLRVLPPDTAMTMDHRPDRLNVDLDEDGVIVRVWCG